MRGRSNVSFFFFKQKTAYEVYQCDWSSDVCSSDLATSRDQLRNHVFGFIFQFYHLLPELTLLENVMSDRKSVV